MAITIDDVYVNTYEQNVRHLAQQGISRARAWVMERSVQSEAHNWERIAKSTAALKDTADAGGAPTATPNGQTVWSRRQSVPLAYAVGDLTETDQIVQMIVDPNGAYARSHGMAMRRAMDTEILSKATGDSRDGAGGAVTFLAGQTVGDGTTAITYDNVTEVTEIFLQNDIDPSERKVFFISPAQQRKLLQLTEATSRDFTEMGQLRNGYVDNWMGYTWVVSTLLPEGSLGAGTNYCIAMSEKAMGFQVNRDVTANIQQDPSASFAWRVYCESVFGAIRVEDEHLVRVDVTNTI
jgi:hypothetical protein